MRRFVFEWYAYALYITCCILSKCLKHLLWPFDIWRDYFLLSFRVLPEVQVESVSLWGNFLNIFLILILHRDLRNGFLFCFTLHLLSIFLPTKTLLTPRFFRSFYGPVQTTYLLFRSLPYWFSLANECFLISPGHSVLKKIPIFI